MPFFTFRQNNSGGWFDFDREQGLTHYTIIEAPDVTAACVEAIIHGIYFDGCSAGIDCSCCGDRWSRPRDYEGYEGYEQPGLYKSGQLAATTFLSGGRGWMHPNPETVVHYADGRRQWFDADGAPHLLLTSQDGGTPPA